VILITESGWVAPALGQVGSGDGAEPSPDAGSSVIFAGEDVVSVMGRDLPAHRFQTCSLLLLQPLQSHS